MVACANLFAPWLTYNAITNCYIRQIKKGNVYMQNVVIAINMSKSYNEAAIFIDDALREHGNIHNVSTY